MFDERWNTAIWCVCTVWCSLQSHHHLQGRKQTASRSLLLGFIFLLLLESPSLVLDSEPTRFLIPWKSQCTEIAQQSQPCQGEEKAIVLWMKDCNKSRFPQFRSHRHHEFSPVALVMPLPIDLCCYIGTIISINLIGFLYKLYLCVCAAHSESAKQWLTTEGVTSLLKGWHHTFKAIV